MMGGEAAMPAIRLQATIDEAVASAIPGLRPLLGRKVELIARQTEREESVEATLTLDELLAEPLTLPPGVGPVSLADMERAIEAGATGRARS
jgi:hypothetical protein